MGETSERTEDHNVQNQQRNPFSIYPPPLPPPCYIMPQDFRNRKPLFFEEKKEPELAGMTLPDTLSPDMHVTCTNTAGQNTT